MRARNRLNSKIGFKRIITVLILFVVTLNVNYLGMIEKKVIVTSKEYKEGNTDNLVLNKILSDNKLKQEIPKMFNYASNGNYINSSYEPLNNPSYITNGLYSSSDEDGTTYYYRGDIDNNNLVFGAYDENYYVYGSQNAYYQTKESCIEAGGNDDICQSMKIASAGDKMYWKIIRVNGDGSLRLIYNGPAIQDIVMDVSFSDDKISGVLGAVPYNLESDDPKYSGYTYDNGTDSFIKKEVDTWYNNTLGSNSLYDSKVIEGRFCSDSSGYNYDENSRFSSFDRLRQAEFDFAKDNAPSFICPTTSESYGGSYRLKAGLITADELVYAGESYGVLGNSYLSPGEKRLYYWSMTPAMLSNNSAYVWFENIGPLFNRIDSFFDGIRPVINIKTENMTLTGDGTEDNPYVLEEVNTNSYKGTVTIEEGSSIEAVNAFEEDINLPSDITWTIEDSSIAKIENNIITGIKEGTTKITGVDSNGTTYEIEVTVIKNPVTNSVVYIGLGIGLILILGTVVYIVYKRKKAGE